MRGREETPHICSLWEREEWVRSRAARKMHWAQKQETKTSHCISSANNSKCSLKLTSLYSLSIKCLYPSHKVHNLL